VHVFCGTEKIESEYTENFQVHLRGCRYHPCHSPLATRIFNTSPFCCAPYSNSSKNARTKYTDKIGHGRKTPYGRLVNDVVQKTPKQPITTIPGIQSSKKWAVPNKDKTAAHGGNSKTSVSWCCKISVRMCALPLWTIMAML
jgi:hypothetical protein